jgi:sugar lactone lactonase YvrE
MVSPNPTNTQTIISNIDCSGLIMNNNGDLYVSDYEKIEVRRWKIEERNGTIVADGNGQGQPPNQFQSAIGLSFDRHGNLYVLD